LGLSAKRHILLADCTTVLVERAGKGDLDIGGYIIVKFTGYQVVAEHDS